MIGCLFALQKKLLLYRDNQREHRWHSEGHVRVIEGSSVLVIGCGDIGSCFGRKMYALGCRVTGIRRRVPQKKDWPDWADGIFGMDQLERLLPEADIVALSLPGGADTRHTLSRERIGLLRRSAVVLNVGRGSAVDTEALADALFEGRIAGAALDVTDPEPLPAGHRLWDAPNTLITPHVSGGFSLPETLEQIVELFARNLERYLAGEPLQNLVDIKTGYRA
ncbi:MAG: D-2-hydroxyacid dehydrogenase [Eubacteriales bacterium]|nr:D-2-hydroxyacid dehydrogenase [Eubacteriales bacterium]